VLRTLGPATLRRSRPTLRSANLIADWDGAAKPASHFAAGWASPMHRLSGMVEPIRDHWVITLALVFATALVVWLAASWRR
jgi:hypothetical protein